MNLETGAGMVREPTALMIESIPLAVASSCGAAPEQGGTVAPCARAAIIRLTRTVISPHIGYLCSPRYCNVNMHHICLLRALMQALEAKRRGLYLSTTKFSSCESWLQTHEMLLNFNMNEGCTHRIFRGR